MSLSDFGTQLDRLNPDLTMDLERTLHFLQTREDHENPEETMAKLKAVLMRQFRYGKGLGFEGAMDVIRRGRS